MSRFNLSDTAKQLAISIVATVISIILTFGVAHLVDKNRQKEKRRQISMMVIHDRKQGQHQSHPQGYSGQIPQLYPFRHF